MSQQEELTGTIDRFLFQSNDNGFSVFVLQTRGTNTVTVKGYVANIHPGEHLTVRGSWVMHPKFGKQFEAEACTATQPTSIVGLKKYLASGMIKGIGPAYAEKLVSHFGVEVLEVIDKEPHRLQEVPGIGKGRVEKIVTAWSDQKEISSIMVFLQDKGISAAYAVKIYKKYRHQAIAVLQENPYRLADEIWGIGFKIADQIAQNMGIALNSIKRVRAGILFCITQAVGNGHLYIELEQLKTATITLLELEEDDARSKIKHALHDLHDSDKIKLVTHEEQHFITLTHYYHSEKGIAHKLLNLAKYPSNHVFNLDAVYASLRTPQSEHDVVLNEEQQRGVMACVQNKVTIITGGPGTGKTTLIKKLLHVLDTNNVSYKLAAPTGRAAKRITEGTRKRATTLHRLLEFDFATRSFAHHENNALKVDFLIIDEASMLDVFLALSVVKALPLHAHLVLIGDVDQLPSVGAGNVLNDCIESGVITSIRLKEIFRQAQDSLIVVNAHRINKGEFPTSFMPDAKRDFLFIKENNPANIAGHLKNIYANGLQKFGIKAHDAMVLVPMNRGAVGTQKLNYDLQMMLNKTPDVAELTSGGTVYKVGDRVMQIRNNYDKHVFNGDIGFIESINTNDREMTVRYPEKDVLYESGEFDELVLAYAITIHKSQGSEYQAAIIPIFMQHFKLLQRNLIYTAITRAKKLCIFIGQPRAIGMAINNDKGVVRTTFLQQFLTTDLACR